MNINVTDIPNKSWIDKAAPVGFRPYLRLARLDRPIGTWLLLLPCWWGLALAGGNSSHWTVYVLFGLGALIMRGAGCTVNDLADRDFDGKVARTRTRPIASGQISVLQGILFLAGQLLIGLFVLLQFNVFSIYLGVASLVLVAIYPFMKRITYWPQLFLGLAFNWGALMGWAVLRSDLSLAPVLLYLSGIFWTLGYDTIYAHQDKDDDALIGIKSSALKLRDKTQIGVAIFYSLSVLLLLAAGYTAQLSWAFYVGMAGAAVHLIWQIISVEINDAGNCLMRFKSNRDFGAIVLIAILLGAYLT